MNRQSKLRAAIILLIFNAVFSFAQPPDIDWQQEYGNLQHFEAGTSALQILDVGYLIGGYHSYLEDHQLIMLIGQVGEMLNYSAYSVQEGYEISKMLYCRNRGVAWITRNSQRLYFSTEQGSLDWWTVEIGYDVTTNIEKLDNNLIAHAYVEDNMNDAPLEMDIYNTFGELVYTTTYDLDGQGVNRISSMDKTPVGEVLLSGLATNNGFVLRINSYGTVTTELYTTESARVTSMSDNGYSIIMRSFGTDSYIQRYSRQNDELWSIDVVPDGFSYKISALRDGGLMTVGVNDLQEGLIRRYDAAGNNLWTYETNYPDRLDTKFYDLVIEESGYTVVGSTGILVGGDILDQIIVVKFTSDVTDYRITTQPFRQQVPQGGWLPWRGGVKNNLPTTETVDVWVQALKPDGSLTGPIRQWNDLTLQTGDSLSGFFWQGIPDDALLGKYNYLVRIGDWPQHRFEDVFSFEVVEANDARAGFAGADAESGELVNDARAGFASADASSGGAISGTPCPETAAAGEIGIQGDSVNRAVATNGKVSPIRVQPTGSVVEDGPFPGFSEAGLHNGVPRAFSPGLQNAETVYKPGLKAPATLDYLDNVPDKSPTGWELTTTEWTRHKGHPRKTGLPQVINTSYGPDMNVGGKTFSLQPVYPNPFNASATVAFNLPYTAPVRADVFDILGRRVRVLVDATINAGLHQLHLNAQGLSSGPYIITITPEGQPAQSTRVTVVK